MSHAWFVIPSARPAAEAIACLDKWVTKGYRIAIWRDQHDEVTEALSVLGDQGLSIVGEYPGYAAAMNLLQRAVFSRDAECDWIVAGGDDTDPDPNHKPEEIAQDCCDYFAGLKFLSGEWEEAYSSQPCTFGVMQPTGDRFAGGSIDRICGSPWLGREFCRRMYGGQGPYFAGGPCHVCGGSTCPLCHGSGQVRGYSHMFVDEELQAVAVKLGVLWQRPDLSHHHNHFMRIRGTDEAVLTQPPPHLQTANSPGHWQYFQRLFKSRQAAGFPGHQPLNDLAIVGTAGTGKPN